MALCALILAEMVPYAHPNGDNPAMRTTANTTPGSLWFTTGRFYALNLVISVTALKVALCKSN